MNIQESLVVQNPLRINTNSQTKLENTVEHLAAKYPRFSQVLVETKPDLNRQ